MCLAAKPKVGKSVFVQQMIFSLTTGTPFLNKFNVPKKCNVLYVQAEGTRQETISRFQAMSRSLQVDVDRLVHISRRDITLMNKKGLRTLIKLASIPEIDYDVIVLDPLYKLMLGGSMNKVDDVTEWVNNSDILFQTFNASGIVDIKLLLENL